MKVVNWWALTIGSRSAGRYFGSISCRISFPAGLLLESIGAVSSGYNDVEMGTLPEGDANNDNCVTVANANQADGDPVEISNKEKGKKKKGKTAKNNSSVPLYPYPFPFPYWFYVCCHQA